jgi:hypothetical protein
VVEQDARVAELVQELRYVGRDVGDARQRIGGVIAKTRHVAAEAAQRLGTHAVATRLAQVEAELETAHGALTGAEQAANDATGRIAEVHGAVTPEGVVELLSRADEVIQTSGDRMLGGLDCLGRAEQLVRAALDGGQPGPLLSMTATVKAALRDGIRGAATARRLINELAATAVQLGDLVRGPAHRPSMVASRPAPVGGPGGDWHISNEVAGVAVKQTTPGSCVAACGEMLAGSRRSQATILAAIGEWSYSEALARHLTGAGEGTWVGGYVEPSFDTIVARGGPWAAEMFPRGGGPNTYHHMVVVNHVGAATVHVRDPWDGSGYDMTLEEFTNRWTGKGVVNNG